MAYRFVVQKQPHCPDTHAEAHRDHELYKEMFGARVLIECDGFTLRLQTNINEGKRPDVTFNVRYIY